MPDLDWSKCPVVESVPGKVSGARVLKGTRLQSKPASNKLANSSERTVASADLFVVGHELHCERANQAK
jgi:hypothetical protein